MRMHGRKDVAERGDIFIPCTREVSIGDGVVYRPVRMWHSGTYAGEGITSVHGDGSGCCKLVQDAYGEHAVCDPPSSVVTRLYWNVARPNDTISAFLSYPNGLGCVDEYFWEAYGTRDDDVERFTGDDAETRMEAAMLAVLGDSAQGTDRAVQAQKEREERPAKVETARQFIREQALAIQAGRNPLTTCGMENHGSFCMQPVDHEGDHVFEDPFTIN